MSRHLLFIDGAWRESTRTHTIKSPYSGRIVAVAEEADDALMERALAAAKAAQTRFRKTSRYLRSCLLAAMARRIDEDRAKFVASIVDEAGKPAALADAEVSRAITTFTVAAEETKRYGGEVFPIDIDAAGRAYEPGTSLFVPRGPVLAITPFNFPLNLVAHKVAPALAIGAPVLVKPAPQAPGAVRLLAEVFEAAANEVSESRETIPLGALQTITAPNEVTGRAIRDPRVAIVSFTGSASVGWTIQSMARGKRVVLELGGNAAVIVHGGADLVRAASRVAYGAFAYAGQVCISVQNVWVEESVEEAFRGFLLDEVSRIKTGDPRAEGVLVGPVIDGKAADRITTWIDEAQKSGVAVLCGGKREGNVLPPTVLDKPGEALAIVREEVFGPVLNLLTYRDVGEAIEAVNRSKYGLQAGVFTDSLRVARRAAEDLEVGGVMINEVPTYRADHMPYGGVKESGLGREGVRYAMEEYSERKTVISYRG
ncbi:aldehyde dehydrogenase family protein [Polyangium spumosum]|uniref:Aldehyde dehydrogenase family protein n=1 Tax=Polyangium spumosum TaxID=889282 RepID=A0A6N7PY51_9BACT|nr:aldehyde dehydrogenase family protein [Polyangium spumosum]MRG95185.1 aldehyde dehydrogenase family protein [Polyangium spumosum]